MSDIAIRVEQLGKAYRITSQRRRRKRYMTLQEELSGVPGQLWRLARGYPDGRETVWALKDVSLEVREGEVVGIIGRKEAGRTTLLKILSGITEPTEGYAEIHGRACSQILAGKPIHSVGAAPPAQAEILAIMAQSPAEGDDTEAKEGAP